MLKIARNSHRRSEMAEQNVRTCPNCASPEVEGVITHEDGCGPRTVLVSELKSRLCPVCGYDCDGEHCEDERESEG
jgi:hypothetical protein